MNTCEATDHNGKCWRHAEEIPYFGIDGKRRLCLMHHVLIEQAIPFLERTRPDVRKENYAWPRKEVAS